MYKCQGFEQEAKTIAKLMHPHIVRILNFDVSNGIPFLVMDYCPDGTLRQRHSKGECVPLATVVTYVKQVADALQYAHDQKIIHRDIKPANMLIGQRDAILLSDFGIASTAHSTHSMRTQTFAGTAPYMAPEQIKLHPRRESDQYALAIVTYQWLCGELPFIGTPEEIAIKHLAVEPPSLCQKLPDLSASVEKIVLKALAKDPKERFPTVQAFATALEQASQAKLSVSMPTQPNITLSQPIAAQVPTVLATPVTPTVDQPSTPPHPIPAQDAPTIVLMPMPSAQTPSLNQLPTQLPNVSPSVPLETPERLSHQPASLQVPEDRRGIATPYHPPIELKQDERNQSRRNVQIGLAIATVIAIITASIIVFQPLLSSTHTGVGNLHTGDTTTNSGSTGLITVGGKSDAEGQLFTEMYTLLLRKNGFTVNEKLTGDANGNFNAIQAGSIDLYPEFTGTALSLLNIKSSFDPQKDYDTIKKDYELQYKLTWLDRAANLNDGYALCMAKAQSQVRGITNISQLASQVSQLILVTPPDGRASVDDLKVTYGFNTTSFKQTLTVDYGISITTVVNNHAQVTICYTTDGSVTQQSLVFLQDDKNGFPAFNPAPVVRDSVLSQYPEIQTILNPLAPKLTTAVSIELQSRVQVAKSSGRSSSDAITQVATDFLKSQGLL
ncbi:MAG TPA: glycine betaine ABC transporter substrate-binding protein [Ktedonobacteraceae bacterium]|nr:glycine betaine ABC transporter substrate-binding protein [Ktedonobacteraceae bacterium]